MQILKIFTGFRCLFQYKCLETRLRITEERLNQERSQRADQLSKTEANLLAENASLKVRVQLLLIIYTYQQFELIYKIFLQML